MDGNENPPLYDDGEEVEDVKKIPKHLRHKKVKDPSSNQISILQTQQIEWLKNYTLEEVKNFEKYCLSVKSTNTLYVVPCFFLFNCLRHLSLWSTMFLII
jgi:hypothetical protein